MAKLGAAALKKKDTSDVTPDNLKIVERVVIKPINLKTLAIRIVGTEPYVQCRWSAEAEAIMRRKQEEGETTKARKERPKKDFKSIYESVLFKSQDGWRGIPASAFHTACIDACRATEFKMVNGKMGFWVEADGYDAERSEPLVRFTGGQPTMLVGPGRNANGSVDIRARGKWEPGWTATVRMTYDADMFRAADIINLMQRAGLQVGIGCGRKLSTDSAGCGWGSFNVVPDKVESVGKK